MQMEETVLTFKVIGDNAGYAYIDLGQASSIVNRKLMRQQGLWEVRGVQLYADVEELGTADRVGLPYTVSMSGAPRNWVTRNSLVKAYHAWIDQQKLALKAAGSRDIKPRWQDFKVLLNDSHRTTGNLIPVSGHMFGNTNPYLEGEWHYSRIVWEEVDGAGAVDQEEPQLCILGDDNLPQTVGLINQYSISRAFPIVPDLPATLPDNIYTQSSEALSAQVEEITDNLMVENNHPPYDSDDYPGGADNGHDPLLFGFVANGSLGNSTFGRKTTMNGFAAPNGLIEVQYNLQYDNQLYDNPELWLQVVVGRRSDY